MSRDRNKISKSRIVISPLDSYTSHEDCACYHNCVGYKDHIYHKGRSVDYESQ